jgi:hypothetical protein
MSTDLWLAIMGTLATFAVIVASGVAVSGIRAWRKETVGKRKIELAEETLEKFYAARDWIQFARHPYAPAGAGQSRPQVEDEDPARTARANAFYVAAERLNQKAELFSRLSTLRYLMRVYFGDKADRPFSNIAAVRNEVVLASHSLAERALRGEWGQLITGADGAVGRPRVEEELEQTIWGLWGEPDKDKITRKLNEAVEQIENICHPHLR